jgi:hypothetical protein
VTGERRQITDVGKRIADDGDLNSEFGMRPPACEDLRLGPGGNELKRIWETERLKAQSADLRVQEAIDKSA